MKDVDAGVSIIALTLGFSAFTHFLPRLSELRKCTKDDVDTTEDVRLGQAAGAAVTIGTGAVVSALTRSNIPIIVAVTVTAGMIAIYEYALRKEHTNGR